MTDNNTIAKEIGYMSYNKLNVFMTILLVGFSAVFALLGDRVTKLNIDMSWPNESTWKRFLNNIWVCVVNIVLLIVALVLLVKKYVTNAINIALFVFVLALGGGIGGKLHSQIWFLQLIPLLVMTLVFIFRNPIIIAAIISIISIGGIGHLLLPENGAYILDGILSLFVLYIIYKSLSVTFKIL